MVKKKLAIWLGGVALFGLFPLVAIQHSAIAGSIGSCPIPLSDARNQTDLDNTIASFANSNCTPVTITQDTTFYRYYSFPTAPAVSKGRFLTTDLFTVNSDAIVNLALLPSFGNTATQEETALVPAGTIIYEGFAGPQPVTNPSSCYAGGGTQDYISDASVVQTIFNFVTHLVVKGDPCVQSVPEPNLAPVICLISLGFLGLTAKRQKN